MKVVINLCYGGFGLSEEALKIYLDRKGIKEEDDFFYVRDIFRCDSDLVEIVETMGEQSWGPYSMLKVVEIPDGIEWQIEEYDGAEWVAEKHRTWQ